MTDAWPMIEACMKHQLPLNVGYDRRLADGLIDTLERDFVATPALPVNQGDLPPEGSYYPWEVEYVEEGD